MDHAFEDEFQKVLQAFALEVDTGSDVFDDVKVRVRFLEIFDLSIEVSGLLGAADSGVDVRTLSDGLLSEQFEHTVDVVHPFSAR